MSDPVADAFRVEWDLAAAARCRGDVARALRHLERAHILGQRRTRLHVRSHAGMLALAWRQREFGAVAGQALRIVAAALFSRLWVPEGNTGGTDVSAFRPMPVPEDLRRVVDAARPPRRLR